MLFVLARHFLCFHQTPYWYIISSFLLSQAVGKAELIDKLKEKTGISKKDIELVLTALTGTVKEEVLDGGKEIRLRDFGTFKQKVSSARTGRNPRTGEELQIKGGKTVGFSVSSSLKVKDA